MHHVQPRSSSAHQLHSTSMTLDEITSALKSSDSTPMSALRAGVAKTDELAPLIFAIADKLCSGVYLLPEENNLLFYGLRIRGVRLAIFGKVIKIDCLASLLPAQNSNSLYRRQ